MAREERDRCHGQQERRDRGRTTASNNRVNRDCDAGDEQAAGSNELKRRAELEEIADFWRARDARTEPVGDVTRTGREPVPSARHRRAER